MDNAQGLKCFCISFYCLKHRLNDPVKSLDPRTIIGNDLTIPESLGIDETHQKHHGVKYEKCLS